jgi:GntR family transcriptional regulator
MTEHPGPRFPPRGRKLVYVQAADLIAARIKDGTYPPESRLPPETEFVAEFGCSRESVRRAIRELRSRGLIETVKGKGSFILPPEERPKERQNDGGSR